MVEDLSQAQSSRRVIGRDRQVRLIEWSLFLFVWFACGITINSGNLQSFNLQQAGVEAMVERRQFSLEGSPTPPLQIKVYVDGDRPFGDTFMYRGRQFAAKQPGQFMFGAVVYFVLHLFGLSYSSNYTLTAALVSLFTASLVTAVASVMVFRIAREFTRRESVAWPLLAAILHIFGTTTFAYSGFAYHDSLAAGYLIIAFYLILLLTRRRLHNRSPWVAAGAAGFLLGLTVTTSMLPFFAACVLAAYLLWQTKSAAVVIGGILGVTPLLIYNARSFGNPLLNSNMAGGYVDSFLRLDLHNSIDKLRFYLFDITLYDPIVWLGLVGLAFYPRAMRRERFVIVAMLVAQLFQILNIETHGGCHYGPRFVLPVLPYAVLGLVGFSYLQSGWKQRLAAIAVVVVGAASVGINAVGALYGAMYCDVNLYAVWPAFEKLRTAGTTYLPLMKPLVFPCVIALVFLIYSTRRYYKRSEYSL